MANIFSDLCRRWVIYYCTLWLIPVLKHPSHVLRLHYQRLDLRLIGICPAAFQTGVDYHCAKFYNCSTVDWRIFWTCSSVHRRSCWTLKAQRINQRRKELNFRKDVSIAVRTVFGNWGWGRRGEEERDNLCRTAVPKHLSRVFLNDGYKLVPKHISVLWHDFFISVGILKICAWSWFRSSSSAPRWRIQVQACRPLLCLILEQ